MHAILLILLITLASASKVVNEYLMGGHLDNNDPKMKTQTAEREYASLGRSTLLDALDLDLDAEESTVGSFSLAKDDEGPRYGPPFSFAFNGGRPFSLEKDPITGKIDYEKAPAVKILNYTDRYEEYDDNDKDKETSEMSPEEDADLHAKKKKIENKDPDDVSPNEINPNSPSFHDFLNLPVRYSSDKYNKDKYPLISSSYANTKVQSGSNSYSTYNHRPYHRETTLYYPIRKTYIPKTSTTTTTMTSTTTVTTTMKPTTLRPSTMSTTVPTTTTTITTTMPSTTTSTTTKAPPVTTWKPSSTSTVRYTINNSNDYEDILSSFNIPIKKFQETISSDHQNPNNLAVPPHRKPVVQLPSKKEEYDMYEDYDIHDESNEEQDYSFDKEVPKEPISSSTISAPPNFIVSSTTSSSTQSSVTTPESTTMRSTTLFSTSAPSSPSSNIISTHPLQFQIVPHPVTSMSIDSDDRELPTFENVVDNRRPGISDGMISNVGEHQVIHQRPLGMGGGQILVGSTSNIVVPPDQDTVSFVLGNRQNVEGGGYYSPGTAIGENPYGGLTGSEASFRPIYGEVSTDQDSYGLEADPQRTVALPSVAVEPNFGYGPQKWWPPNSGPPLKNSNEIESSKIQSSIVRGTMLMEQEDVRNEEKDSNRIAFPKTEEEKHSVEEHIVIINEADGTVQELPPSTTIMPSKTKSDTVSTVDDHLPQLSENLTPPAERPMPPSPYYFHHQHGGTARPDYPRPPQRLPLPPARGKPFPPPPLPPPIPDSLAIRRRPYPSDTKLPNILPQFRPNAKVSHGHRNPENIGTIPAPQAYPNRVRQPSHVHPPSRRPLPPAPSYLQRLNPPPPPIHAIRLAGSSSTIVENIASVQESEPTVKRFRHPAAVQSTSRGESDENTNQPNRLPGQKQKLRLEDEETSERYSEEPPQMPPRPPLFPRRRTADPPRVTTLQMIQQRGELEEEEEATGLASSNNNDPDQETKNTMVQEMERRKDIRDSVAEAPVYVVYPVNTAVNIDPDDSGEDESVVVGTRGPHRPLPPETLLRDDKVREKINEEESTMIDLYNGRPVRDFSYSLDRVDPSIYAGPVRETPILVPSDQRHESRPLNEKDEEKEDGDHVNVIPYLQDFVPFSKRKNDGVISATLHRMPNNNHPSSTPIAYVYTPTAEASHHLDVDVKDDGSKMNKNDQRPILLPSQQPSSSSSSAPSPQNFMAPFVASLRAEAPAKNGWNVVVIESNDKATSDDKTDDVHIDDESTKKSEFDPENFKPQLFGGFKPIFEFPMDDNEGTEGRESSKGNSSIPKNVQQEAVDSAA
ncbi:uncharacterized protein LOC124956496 isoform X1 [Vespa velutina]|uniref:uncharacterized protein LOC124956496 isoform X1 n=1 Tax=Vespa velutina TaxID=202808 RepID=UPI001FB52690|nr:uncharacterized protein LOC124956496 isoform X1 [Vespa velutina]